MAIERISELPWASFEAQLIQKCETYLFKKHAGMSPESYNYWITLSNPPRIADAVYSIQQQILYNASALNNEVTLGDDDRYSDKDIFFWNDLVQHQDEESQEFRFEHEGYENTYDGRNRQMGDELFVQNTTFTTHPYRTQDDAVEQTDLLTSLPKTHAARSLIEVSEYLGPNNPESRHSNYVSRKVSMLWFFNVIKAIATALRTFPWLRIGVQESEISCHHPEAEADPNVKNDSVSHTAHKFKRSLHPDVDGRLTTYGNAEFNGLVTTFHSQARFHDEVTIWDKLSVYGQSFFSKDINGTAMRTRWGDLAEYYKADANYEPGTLVTFGGKEEVTIAISIANAVVTSNPGLVLNEEMRLKTDAPEHPIALALVGRVPVKVWGPCKKFTSLVADPEHPGWARAQIFDSEHIIARALEDKTDSGNLVLCATNFKI